MTTPGALTLLAPAKINWGLAVCGQRPDGYHLLRMVNQSIDLADRLRLRRQAQDALVCEPPLPGPAAENLALRAWQLIKREYDLPGGLLIRITKKIPVGAGLAGGSTDAAAVLRGVNTLFDLKLSLAQLQALGLRLGADLPYCLQGGLAEVAGIGERIKPVAAQQPLWLLLLNPGFAVATGQVFRAYRAAEAGPAPQIEALAAAVAAGDRAGITAAMANQLTTAATMLHPEIAALHTLLRGCGLQPLMSGSGGTVLAVVADEAAADSYLQALSGQAAWAAKAQTLISPQHD